MQLLIRLAFFAFCLHHLVGCTIVGTEPEEVSNRRAEAIRRNVLHHGDKLRKCYDYELKKDPKTPSGKVVMQWEVDQDGRPQKISADPKASTLKIPTLEQCLIVEFTEMNFPSPSKGDDLKVRYPLVFTNEGLK